jgi:C4-dicarboxylate-specific signal transduction histidine kinase
MLREAGIHLAHNVARPLPRVRADHQGLLQVFLNLAQNFERALSGQPYKKITLEAYATNGSAVIRFGNNGPVLENPERLFHPLQPRASAIGLGMFISRAILRTHGGELQHIPQPEGCCFLIQIPVVEAPRVQRSA